MASSSRASESSSSLWAAVAWVFIIITYTTQTLIIAWIMSDWSYITLVFLFIDVPLLLNILFSYSVRTSALKGSIQWTWYSWSTAAKLIVLYLKVEPYILNRSSSETSQTIFQSVEHFVLTAVLFLTPVIYTLMMFRATKQLFRSVTKTINISVLLHFDMMIHVTLDLVDVLSLYNSARESSINSQVKQVIAAFIFLAVFFHGYSFAGQGGSFSVSPVRFPSHNSKWAKRDKNSSKSLYPRQSAILRPRTDSIVRHQSISTPPANSHLDIRDDMTNGISPETTIRRSKGRRKSSYGVSGVWEPFCCDNDPGWIIEGRQQEIQDHSRHFPPVIGFASKYGEYEQMTTEADVISTRKHSALVSICFVDIPFLILRLVLYLGPAQLAISAFAAKNGLYLALQALRLQQTRQAERSHLEVEIQPEHISHNYMDNQSPPIRSSSPSNHYDTGEDPPEIIVGRHARSGTDESEVQLENSLDDQKKKISFPVETFSLNVKMKIIWEVLSGPTRIGLLEICDESLEMTSWTMMRIWFPMVTTWVIASLAVIVGTFFFDFIPVDNLWDVWSDFYWVGFYAAFAPALLMILLWTNLVPIWSNVWAALGWMVRFHSFLLTFLAVRRWEGTMLHSNTLRNIILLSFILPPMAKLLQTTFLVWSSIVGRQGTAYISPTLRSRPYNTQDAIVSIARTFAIAGISFLTLIGFVPRHVNDNATNQEIIDTNEIRSNMIDWVTEYFPQKSSVPLQTSTALLFIALRHKLAPVPLHALLIGKDLVKNLRTTDALFYFAWVDVVSCFVVKAATLAIHFDYYSLGICLGHLLHLVFVAIDAQAVRILAIRKVELLKERKRKDALSGSSSSTSVARILENGFVTLTAAPLLLSQLFPTWF
eukprot:GHVL01025301.1.p1 GENE.GHVL01025301.1~~GHVL01025301.1.p1  ORF type:complete len:879 (-),score=127.80 GHVL01025301.1:608-3244(-)